MARWNWERTVAVLLLAPSVIATAVFIYAFIGFTGYVSLSNWRSLIPDFTFVGFENYKSLFAHPRFQIDMRNTFTFMLLFLGGCVSIGFLLALLLDQGIRGEGLANGPGFEPGAAATPALQYSISTGDEPWDTSMQC